VWQPSTGACDLVLRGHTQGINCMLVLPDKRVVSGARLPAALPREPDTAIRLWQPAGRDNLGSKGHASDVTYMAVLPGDLVVTGSRDCKAIIWEPLTVSRVRVLVGHTKLISSFLVLSDGNLISCSDDKTMRVWQLSTGECLHALEHPWGMFAVALANGRVVSDSGECLRVWQPSFGICELVLEGHTKGFFSGGIAELPDGRIVSGSSDTTVRVWNATTGACELVLSGHTDGIVEVAVLPDGRIVSGENHRRAIRVWNSVTGACEREVLPATLNAFFHSDEFGLYDNRPDDERGAVNSHDGIRVRRINAGVIADGPLLSRVGHVARAFVDAHVTHWAVVAHSHNHDTEGSVSVVLGCKNGGVHCFRVVPDMTNRL
jgi:WD40 repeat protein